MPITIGRIVLDESFSTNFPQTLDRRRIPRRGGRRCRYTLTAAGDRCKRTINCYYERLLADIMNRPSAASDRRSRREVLFYLSLGSCAVYPSLVGLSRCTVTTRTRAVATLERRRATGISTRPKELADFPSLTDQPRRYLGDESQLEPR